MTTTIWTALAQRMRTFLLTADLGGGGAMRDPRDAMTIGLPGIELLPFIHQPAATTASMRRAASMYRGPRERTSCRNCQHRHEVLTNTGSAFAEGAKQRCGKHAFPVELGAVCADHTPEGAG